MQKQIVTTVMAEMREEMKEFKKEIL